MAAVRPPRSLPEKIQPLRPIAQPRRLRPVWWLSFRRYFTAWSLLFWAKITRESGLYSAQFPGTGRASCSRNRRKSSPANPC